MEFCTIIFLNTTDLTGEFSDAFFVATRGDSRIAVTLPKDEETLSLGRDARFIIDDYAAPNPLAYRLTKPFKLGGSYDDDGVVIFVMTECNSEFDDNPELHIADYYKYFPRENDLTDNIALDTTVPDEPTTGRQGWI